MPAIFTPPAAGKPASAAAAPAVAAPAPSPVISAALAASIATVLPAFPAPAAAPTTPAPPPRNRIPRLPAVVLPKVTVHDRRIREFTERETYTPAGLEDLAIRRYLSDFDRFFLNRINLPIVGETNGDRALQLFDQDEKIARAREIAELWRLDAIKDPDRPAAPTP